ncbi:hypothetical protein DFP73DRAFT_553239 [Morchella snyderi]|nr:hypothetical protein DFP73DRAFT_553239 [Morchella snyderi]
MITCTCSFVTRLLLMLNYMYVYAYIYLLQFLTQTQISCMSLFKFLSLPPDSTASIFFISSCLQLLLTSISAIHSLTYFPHYLYSALILSGLPYSCALHPHPHHPPHSPTSCAALRRRITRLFSFSFTGGIFIPILYFPGPCTFAPLRVFYHLQVFLPSHIYSLALLLTIFYAPPLPPLPLSVSAPSLLPRYTFLSVLHHHPPPLALFFALNHFLLSLSTRIPGRQLSPFSIGVKSIGPVNNYPTGGDGNMRIPALLCLATVPNPSTFCVSGNTVLMLEAGIILAGFGARGGGGRLIFNRRYTAKFTSF